MKTRIIAFLAVALFACGAPAETVEWIDGMPSDPSALDVPGQEFRIDGDVWTDGMFNSAEAREDFCAEHPEAWFCSELGTAEQAWTSVEYHGQALGSAVTCYGPSFSNNGDCLFPATKKFRLHVTSGNCFLGQPPPVGPSTLQEQALLDGIRNAAMEWDNVGNIDVCISGVAGCSGSGFVDVTIDCNYVGPSDGYASGGLTGTGTARVGNAPVGPNSGKDADDFFVGTTGKIGLNVVNSWNAVKACYPNPTIGNIKSWIAYSGKHEFGHVLGFGHYNVASLLMSPFHPGGCNPARSVHANFVDALTQFDPSGGSASVPAGLLWANSPL